MVRRRPCLDDRPGGIRARDRTDRRHFHGMTAGVRKRFDAIDVARGVALVAMAAYHFTWDLAYFRVISASAPFTAPMRLASHTIGGGVLAPGRGSLAPARGP